MLIVVFALLLGAMIVFIYKANKTKQNEHAAISKRDLFIILSVITTIATIIEMTVTIGVSISVATASTIDRKIEMYEEENANIEKQIDTAVKGYMEHEQNTFKNVKTDESTITLVTLFPELKADTLVQKQLDIYVKNNETIKSLKTDRIHISKLKWLLYFGK